MTIIKVAAAIFTFGMALSSGPALAQEAARVHPKTPSIIYYGGELNQRVDAPEYFESQGRFVEGQQGQHLSRMEDGRRQRTATGYGAISEITGNHRTTYVSGHTRKDGTYVQPYYRSRR